MKNNRIKYFVVIVVLSLFIFGCAAAAPADGTAAAETGAITAETGGAEASGGGDGADDAQAQTGGTEAETGNSGSGQVASAGEMSDPVEVVREGMIPVYGSELKDGVYTVQVDSSSSMFRVTGCELSVRGGEMSAVMTMGGTGYLKLFMGTGAEAVNAAEEEYIPFVETEDGGHTFQVPVEALDLGIDCSAFSKKKEKWYDRTLVFRADSLPLEAFADGRITTAESLDLADGAYTAEVTLEGGSGKASVESPAPLRVEGGKVYATITWSSPNYDYMKVDGVKYELVSSGGNSAFEIPVSGFDWKLPVIADTIAMSEPHEIDYTLSFDSATLKKVE